MAKRGSAAGSDGLRPPSLLKDTDQYYSIDGLHRLVGVCGNVVPDAVRLADTEYVRVAECEVESVDVDRKVHEICSNTVKIVTVGLYRRQKARRRAPQHSEVKTPI